MVTAVITSYKRKPEIVKRALDSVINQTYKNIEIILVDDNREDQEGEEISKELDSLISGLRDQVSGEMTIKIIRTIHGKHGAQAARNTGIDAAAGEYVAFLDDDDEWLPEKMEKQVQLMDNNPEAGMCFTAGYRVDENYEPPFVKIYHGNFKDRVSYKDLLREDCIGTTSQAFIRKSVLEKVGGFDENLPARQDYEMWIRISREYDILGVNIPLFNNRISSNMTQISKGMDNCIEGHTLLYQKYRNDIDNDKQARFNVEFCLGHYYFFKGDKVNGVKKYLHALVISPKCMLRKLHQKKELIRDSRKAKNK